MIACYDSPKTHIHTLMCCPTFLLAVWNTEAIACPDKVIQFHCYAEGKVEQQGEACVALSQWVLLWKIYSLMRVM